MSLVDGRHFIKSPTGRLLLSTPGLTQLYEPPNPDDGAFPNGRILVRRTPPEQMKEIPAWKPVSAWDRLVGEIESRAERHDEMVDGRRLVRFDLIHADALENKEIRSQI